MLPGIDFNLRTLQWQLWSCSKPLMGPKFKANRSLILYWRVLVSLKTHSIQHTLAQQQIKWVVSKKVVRPAYLLILLLLHVIQRNTEDTRRKLVHTIQLWDNYTAPKASATGISMLKIINAQIKIKIVIQKRQTRNICFWGWKTLNLDSEWIEYKMWKLMITPHWDETKS